MQKIAAQGDGVVFGVTSRHGRTYISMNYHRHSFKKGKTLWHQSVAVPDEAEFFDTSDDKMWECKQGHYWWIDQGGKRVIGAGGEFIAFFPHCPNHPGPWHGYPVSPRDDEHYEVPEEIVLKWESGTNPWIDDLIAGRIRKGKI